MIYSTKIKIENKKKKDSFITKQSFEEQNKLYGFLNDCGSHTIEGQSVDPDFMKKFLHKTELESNTINMGYALTLDNISKFDSRFTSLRTISRQEE